MQAPKIDRYLAADGGLRPVIEKARDIAALSKLCERALPPELARLVRAANLKNGTLVLLAPSPAAAAKLKLLSETLRSFLLMQGTEVKSVSVRVQPTMSHRASDVAPHKSARLSASALAELRALYDRLGDSPARRALGALLERQASNGRDAAPKATSGSPPRRAGPNGDRKT